MEIVAIINQLPLILPCLGMIINTMLWNIQNCAHFLYFLGRLSLKSKRATKTLTAGVDETLATAGLKGCLPTLSEHALCSCMVNIWSIEWACVCVDTLKRNQEYFHPFHSSCICYTKHHISSFLLGLRRSAFRHCFLTLFYLMYMFTS